MTTEPATAQGRYRDAFASAEFRALFGAHVVHMLGSVLAGLALMVLIYRQTGSALLSALTITMSFVPYLVGGLFLSGLVDRLAPRRLLVGSALVSAAMAAVMPVPGLPVAVLFGLLFCMNLLAPLSTGARSALLPEMLPPGAVIPARSLIRMVALGAQVGGYAVGGLLLAVLSPRVVLVLDAVCLLSSALVLRVFLRRRPARGAGRASLVGDSLEGVREVFRVPALARVLWLSWLVPFLMVAPEAVAAPWVADRGLSDAMTGWWLAAMPLGTVLGEVCGLWLIPAARRRDLTRPLAALGFVPLLVFAAHPSLGPALALLVASGLCSAYLLGIDQWTLDVTPPELLGRAYSVGASGLMAVQGAGFAGAGALAEFLPPDVVIVLAGAAGLAVAGLLRGGSGSGQGRLILEGDDAPTRDA